MRYRVIFYGRVNGALGIGQRLVRVVEARDPNHMLLRLYETHEHINVLESLPTDEPETAAQELRT